MNGTLASPYRPVVDRNAGRAVDRRDLECHFTNGIVGFRIRIGDERAWTATIMGDGIMGSSCQYEQRDYRPTDAATTTWNQRSSMPFCRPFTIQLERPLDDGLRCRSLKTWPAWLCGYTNGVVPSHRKREMDQAISGLRAGSILAAVHSTSLRGILSVIR